MRYGILVLIAAGLALGVFFLWPDPDQDDPTPTQAVATTTTTESPASTTSTADFDTTTTTVESRILTSVEEAEEILRELWFGWFEGIYNEDEQRIREVVANERLIEQAVDQFGEMEFVGQPSRELIKFADTELLYGDDSCTAVWSNVLADEIVGASNDGVYVFVWNDGWFFISQWASRDDIWQNDCEAQLQ